MTCGETPLCVLSGREPLCRVCLRVWLNRPAPEATWRDFEPVTCRIVPAPDGSFGWIAVREEEP